MNSVKETNKTVHIIKVKLGNKHRILAIPSFYTLYDLAEAIVNSFDFGFDHCFGFYDTLGRGCFDSKEGYELFADIGEESDFPGVKKTKINKVFDKIGKKMLFLFDYGDNWRFVIELIEIRPFIDDKCPIVIKSVGKAPEQY